jgi:uncharacterized membrane protein
MKNLKVSLIASAIALVSFNGAAAKYQIVDLSTSDTARHSFALGVNNNDEVVGIAREHFDFPIDLDNLNITALALELAFDKVQLPDALINVNIEDIQNGDINADALAYIRSFLISNRTNSQAQKIGDQSAFIAAPSGTVELTLLDQVEEELGGKTRNTVDLVNAINDNGISVSSATAVYQKTDFTPEPTDAVPEPTTSVFWLRDALNRQGVITKGDQKMVVASEAQEHGGESELTDISNSGYVVGFAAASITTIGQEQSDLVCGEITEVVSLNLCLNTLYTNLANPQLSATPMFETRAYRWKINDALEIVETKNLGLSFTPLDTDGRTHQSFATGVNEIGHVSGYSDDFITENNINIATQEFATYYDGDTLTRITDPDEHFRGRALDINDNDIVVGYGTKLVSGLNTDLFFYYDATTGVATYPEGFFTSSASQAHAINNNGQIVGSAQIDSSFGTQRREQGFIYEIATSTLTNLNDLVTCDSLYTIVEAKDINDNGVIVGTALLTVDKKDAKGAAITDADGTVQREDVARAVKLVPVVDGVIDNCEVVAPPAAERKGATLGFYSLLMLLGVFSRRRLVR